jgi:hypothetical protein
MGRIIFAFCEEMRAGLTNRRLTLREVFLSAMVLWVSKRVAFGQSIALIIVNKTRISRAAQQQLMTKAPPARHKHSDE